MSKILIIEDTQPVREEIATLLRFEGFEVIEAQDGVDGVRQALESPPDLIICDILMPAMDGYAVLENLRRSAATALTPFIFLTAKSNRSDMRNGMNLGADDYLTKPFTATELLTAVQSRLSHRSRIDSHVTQQLEESRHQLHRATNFDGLTGLPNRNQLRDSLKEVFNNESAARSITLIVLDIDRFHNFNDALGPEFGDEIIKFVAERVNRALPGGAMLFRQVGDRFIITLPDAFSSLDAARAAQELMSAVKQPTKLRNQDFRITASAGIASYPADAATFDELLQNAELALIQAKQTGVDTVRHFNPALRNEAMDRIRLKSDLFEALNRREMFLCYQPLVDIATGRCVALEALLRWNHQSYGMVSPAIFIPLAEEAGMIGPIGEWVMKESLRFMNTISLNGLSHLAISINVSGRQFQDPEFLNKAGAMLRQSRLPARQIVLELTENVLMSEAETNINTMNQLKEMGFSLAIDDFGTGYSSLAYLKRFQIDTLKIDRSFIRDLTRHSSDASIVEGILRIADSLKLGVVAEGVESKDQLDFLAELRCQHAQGFYFSKPLNDKDILTFLQVN